jgi:hypothetical protein
VGYAIRNPKGRKGNVYQRKSIEYREKEKEKWN